MAHEQVQPLHSRVSSSQNLAAGRSSTPKIPPGFDTSHSHPSSGNSQPVPSQTPQQKGLGISAGIVVPAVPVLSIGHRASTPKDKSSEATDETKTDKQMDSVDSRPATPPSTKTKDISLGSPKPRSTLSKTEPDSSALQSNSSAGFRHEPPASTTDGTVDPLTTSPASTDRRNKVLGHIEIPTTSSTIPPTTDSADSKSETPVIASTMVATPPLINSRPSTPATATSEVSKASIQRPRTIRVTTSNISRTNTDMTSSPAITERSIFMPPSSAQSQSRQTTQRSRAASITSGVSQSRPSTPAMSHDFSTSRASSPRPSIVGSAPERTKSKAQQKKERKKKTTETSEPSTSSVAPTPPVVEQVAPVVGRQRKVKKIGTGSGVDSSKEDKVKAKAKENSKSTIGEPLKKAKTTQDVAKTTADESTSKSKQSMESIEDSSKNSSKGKDSKKTDAKPASSMTPMSKDDSKITQLEEPRQAKKPYTLLDLYTESARHKHDPAYHRKLLNEHVSGINKIFASLLDSRELEPTSALLGGQPPLNSAAYKLPPDSRKGSEYLDANGYTDSNPFGHIYLRPKEKKALWKGESFGVADEREGRQGDLLRRALVTGGGVVYRHLSREQEDKVMELEAKREYYAAQWGAIGGIGIMNKLGKLEDEDYINIEGGVADLIRHGEKHGIGWVKDSSRDEWDDDADADDEDGDQFDDDYDDSDDKTDDLGLGLESTVGAWEAAQGAGMMLPGMTAAHAQAASAGKAPSAKMSVNLRAMDTAQLHKRVKETMLEMEAMKKEMEKVEKLYNKKAKEVAKWREGVPALKA